MELTGFFWIRNIENSLIKNAKNATVFWLLVKGERLEKLDSTTMWYVAGFNVTKGLEFSCFDLIALWYLQFALIWPEWLSLEMKIFISKLTYLFRMYSKHNVSRVVIILMHWNKMFLLCIIWVFLRIM